MKKHIVTNLHQDEQQTPESFTFQKSVLNSYYLLLNVYRRDGQTHLQPLSRPNHYHNWCFIAKQNVFGIIVQLVLERDKVQFEEEC